MPRLRSLVVLACLLCAAGCSSSGSTSGPASDGGSGHSSQPCIEACHAWSDRKFSRCLIDGAQAQCQADDIARRSLCDSITAAECDEDLLETFEDDENPGGEGGTSSTTGGVPPSPPGEETGSGDCVEGEAWCEGTHLVECDLGEARATECDAVCLGEGLGSTLGCDDSGYGNAACICEGPDVCATGESMCISSEAGVDCIDGQWSDPISCDELCQGLGYDLSSDCVQQGAEGVCECRYGCNPATETTACAADPSYLMWCYDGGWWEYWDCEDRCAQYGALGTTGCQWHPAEGVYDCNCLWP